jgi:two-component sensor histidine kinase
MNQQPNFMQTWRKLKTFKLALSAAVIALLLIWGIALERINYERARAVSDEIRKNANLAQSHQERASRSFQVLDQVLLSVRTDYVEHGIPKSLGARVKAIWLEKRFLGDVTLVGPRGEWLAGTGRPPASDETYREQLEAHAKESADVLRIGKPVKNKTDDAWIMTLSRRISNSDGSFGGVALLSLDAAFFASGYEQSEHDAFGSMALIGLDGIIRARRTGDKLSFGADNKSSQVFKELAKAPKGHYVSPSPSDGHRRIVAYRTLDDYPMVTAVGSSLETVIAVSRGREIVYLGAAAGATVLVIFFTLAYMVMVDRRALARAALQVSLAEKTALLMEVHHRVKNNLQVISSLLRMEARHSTTAETRGVLGDMKNRIYAMAQLHELLYRSGTFASVDLGSYLGQLATQTFQTQALQPKLVELKLDMGSVQVSMDQASAAGLILNELISNCLKHSFSDGHSGEIAVALKPAPDNRVPGDARWCLCVSDTGMGLPKDFEEKRNASLGMQLVSDLSEQLHGALTIESTPGKGVQFSVVFTALAPAALVMPT